MSQYILDALTLVIRCMDAVTPNTLANTGLLIGFVALNYGLHMLALSYIGPDKPTKEKI